MDKSAFELINDFNAVAAHIPPHTRDKIYHNVPVPQGEADATVNRAVYLWNEIQKRLNCMPNYSLMVQ